MTAMRLRVLPVVVSGVLVAGLAALVTVAGADERGPTSGRAPHGWGESRRWGDWGGWHGSRARLGLYYGGPYDFYDPWYYPAYRSSYYGSPFVYGSSSEQPRYVNQGAYDLGRDDALNGRPRHYVKGETPGYSGNARKAYMAGYASGLLEQTQREQSERYQPPTHYEPPVPPTEGGPAPGG
jgi:hypothetical protein